LTAINEIIDKPIGGHTFGGIIHKYRNKVIVHTTYHDVDLNCIYNKVDMLNNDVKEKFNTLLYSLYEEIKKLAINIIEETGLPFEEFGLYHV